MQLSNQYKISEQQFRQSLDRLSQKIKKKIILIHPLGSMDIRTNFYRNPFNS